MLSGSCAGELTFISRTPRNATVVAEVDSSLFKLDVASFDKMEKEVPTVAKELLRILLKGLSVTSDLLRLCIKYLTGPVALVVVHSCERRT